MSNKREPMITPTSMALDKAADLVQELIDSVENSVIPWNKNDVKFILKKLKVDIQQRKSPVERVRLPKEMEDSWRASPDRMGGQFTTEEINKDLQR